MERLGGLNRLTKLDYCIYFSSIYFQKTPKKMIIPHYAHFLIIKPFFSIISLKYSDTPMQSFVEQAFFAHFIYLNEFVKYVYRTHSIKKLEAKLFTAPN